MTKNFDKLARKSHLLITKQVVILFFFLHWITGCVDGYFLNDDQNSEKKDAESKKSNGYKCVLNSKASEDSLVHI